MTTHTPESTIQSRNPAAANTESVPALIKSLANDVSTLVSTEMALARAEIREATSEAKAGISGMAFGGIIAPAGTIILLMSAVYGLGQFIELWLSALIVGVIVLAVGIAMLKGGQTKLEPGAFVPERTQSGLAKDKNAVKRRAS